jgi:hypothetical protein
MKRELEAEMDALLKARRDKEQSQVDERLGKQQRERDYRKRFSEFRRNLMYPSLQALASAFQSKGIEAHVDFHEKKQGSTSPDQDGAGITFAFASVQKGKESSLSIHCDPVSEQVGFHSKVFAATGTADGSAGFARLEELTDEIIHEKVHRVFLETYKQ